MYSIPHNFQSGFVFGIEFLAAFLMSSVMSLIGSKFSYRTLAVLGTFTLGVEVIAFGMLELTDDAVIFLTLSYIIRLEIVYYVYSKYTSGMHNQYLIKASLNRFLEGISSSLALSSFTTLFMVLFPHKVATSYSWASTVQGVGYSIGPAIGGLLYDMGGFYLPFLVIGILGVIFSTLIQLALPVEESQISEEAEKPGIFTTFMIIKKVEINLYPNQNILFYYSTEYKITHTIH